MCSTFRDSADRRCQPVACSRPTRAPRHRNFGLTLTCLGLTQDQDVSPHFRAFRAKMSVSSSSYPRAVSWIWNSLSTRARPLLPSRVRNGS